MKSASTDLHLRVHFDCLTALDRSRWALRRPRWSDKPAQGMSERRMIARKPPFAHGLAPPLDVAYLTFYGHVHVGAVGRTSSRLRSALSIDGSGRTGCQVLTVNDAACAIVSTIGHVAASVLARHHSHVVVVVSQTGGQERIAVYLKAV